MEGFMDFSVVFFCKHYNNMMMWYGLNQINNWLEESMLCIMKRFLSLMMHRKMSDKAFRKSIRNHKTARPYPLYMWILKYQISSGRFPIFKTSDKGEITITQSTKEVYDKMESDMNRAIDKKRRRNTQSLEQTWLLIESKTCLYWKTIAKMKEKDIDPYSVWQRDWSGLSGFFKGLWQSWASQKKHSRHFDCCSDIIVFYFLVILSVEPKGKSF